MRIAFLGSGEFGRPTLDALAAKHTLVGVVSQPDRPAGRGTKLTPTPISAWAAEHAPTVAILKPEDVNTPEMLAAIRSWRADAMVIIAFGQKLSNDLIDPALLAPGFAAINLHASLLPRWRGAAPINWAILGGDAVTGNSVISIAQRMDAGLVFGTSRREILPHQTAGDLHDLLSADGPELVLRVLAEMAAGTARGETQDETLKTRASKLSREMAVVDFAKPADACRRTINGLSPWPGVTVQFRGEPLKLLRATSSDQTASAAPGTILDSHSHHAHDGFIACGGGTVLKLLEVQPAGKRAMPWKDFANGHKLASQELLVGSTPTA